MKNIHNNRQKDDDMRNEYDFSNSMPNKYAAQLKRQERLISLEPDVYKVFKTSEQVNHALRAIISAYPNK